MVRPTDQEMIIVEKLILIAPERSKDTPCHTGPHKVGGRQRELGELQESLYCGSLWSEWARQCKQRMI